MKTIKILKTLEEQTKINPDFYYVVDVNSSQRTVRLQGELSTENLRRNLNHYVKNGWDLQPNGFFKTSFELKSEEGNILVDICLT